MFNRVQQLTVDETSEPSYFYAIPLLKSDTKPSDLLIRTENIAIFFFKPVYVIKDTLWNEKPIFDFLDNHVIGFKLFASEEKAKQYNTENIQTDKNHSCYQPIFFVQPKTDIILKKIRDELKNKRANDSAGIDPYASVEKNDVLVIEAMCHWSYPHQPEKSQGGMRCRLIDLLHEHQQAPSLCTIT